MAYQLATAYVQVVPTTKGIKKNLENEFGGAGGDGAKSFADAFKKAIATAGVATAAVKAFNIGAELEQSIGGIETLFKGYEDEMMNYADKAYKTAGISANDYMQQVTSFSASLMQSFKGVENATQLAGDAANQAIIDMADNANKMGTDLSSIQNAYQGFAKQNYTMLDNLKLGYGGTKTEMERLLKDATKLSGTKYNINNLADVYSAIHVIQNELGITGTTAQEAATTLSGSFASMKASAENVMAYLVNGLDVSEPLNGLIDSAMVFLRDNLIPAIQNVLSGALVAIDTFVKTGGFSSLMKTIIDLIKQLIVVFIDNLPLFFDVGIEIIKALWDGIKEMFEWLWDNAPEILQTIIDGIVAVWNNIINIGKDITKGIWDGISTMFEWLTKKAKEIVDSVVSGIKSAWDKLVSVGENMVEGIWEGIVSAKDWLFGKISGWVGDVVEWIKDCFDINSPSKVMADEVGKYLPMGIAKGIDDNAYLVDDAMAELVGNTRTIATANVMADIRNNSLGNLGNGENLKNIIKEALIDSDLKVELDGREMGRLVLSYE